MKVIFIFCEGVHDISFLNTVLSLDENFKIFDKKISQYPLPLNTYFSKKFEEYKNLDLRFKNPVYPLIPSLTYTDKAEKTILVFYNSGGMNKYKEVNIEIETIKMRLPGMINDLTKQIKDTTRIIESFGFLFVYDADNDGIAVRFQEFKEHYSSVLKIQKEKDENDFKNESKTKNEIKPNEWSNEKQLGCYIFTANGSDKGSLEDIVIPLIKDVNRYNKGKEYIEVNKLDDEKVSKNENKVNKASITVAGQFYEPGSSMSVILQNPLFLNSEQLKQDTKCQEIINFFKGIVA